MKFNFLKKTASKWFRSAQLAEKYCSEDLIRDAMNYSSAIAQGLSPKWDEEGRKAKRKKCNTEIKNCIDKALELDQFYAPALLAKGELTLHYSYSTNSEGLNDVKFDFSEEAVRCFEKCISITPPLASAFYYMGRIYESRNELDRAINCYEKVIELNQLDSEAWYGKSRILKLNKEDMEAKECLEKAVKFKAPEVGYRWLHIS